MDLRDPIEVSDDGDETSTTALDEVCVVEVSQRTQEHLT